MTTRNLRSSTLLTLAVMVGVFAASGGTVQAAETILEHFDYPAGDLAGANGGTGFGGAWTTTEGGTGANLLLVKDGGLSFQAGAKELATAGNSVYRSASAGRAEANRAISAASQTALLADGTTIWFSVLYQNINGASYNAAFLIGTDTYNVGSTGNLNLVAAGDGFGFGNPKTANIQALAYENSTTPVLVDSGIDPSTVRLIVGKITWAAAAAPDPNDTLELYEVTDLTTEPTTPAATVKAVLNQSAFDVVVLQHNNATAIFDEIRIGTTYVDVLGTTKAHDPTPANGAEDVVVEGATLSWKTGLDTANPTLPNPNIKEHYLWLSAPYPLGTTSFPGQWWNEPGARQFTTGADTDPADGNVDPNVSMAITGLQKDRLYLWVVDEGLVGSSGPLESDPAKIIWGDTWRFETETADAPPDVDAGKDIVTWSGQAVQLDPNIVDDGASALTYAWSAENDDGFLDVLFSPSNNVENPKVTITKVASSVIPIANPGFEAEPRADGEYNWAHQGWGWFANAENVGTWNPGFDTGYMGYGGNAPEGQNVGFVDPGGVGAPGGFAQVLTETLTADTTYTLTVQVGNTPGYPWGGYRVQLLAGGGTPTESEITAGTLIAEDDNTLAISEGAFMTSTVTYTYNPELHSDLLGEPLQIRLLSGGNVAADDDTEADFDNVRLTVDPPLAPPAGFTAVTLTLGVSDVLNPTPVEDTLKIDVYDDACQAATAMGLAADNSGDLNGDCLTDFNDLALMVATWLVDYALTEPFAIP